MSSRQLKKLRKQQELLGQHSEPAHDEESEEEQVQLNQPRKNPFAGFAALAGAGDEEEEEEAEEEVGEEDGETQQTKPETRETEPAPSAAKKSKKPKKKNKKKKGKKPEAEPDDGLAREEDGDGIDEIDKAIEDLRKEESSRAKQQSDTPDAPGDLSDKIAELVRINLQHLKASYEMRRLFGREIIQSVGLAGNDEEVAGQNRRRRAVNEAVNLEEFLRGRPGKTMPEALLRRNPFIEGKKTWPADSARGLTMTCLNEYPGDFAEYTFTHDKTYQLLEATFFHLVQMYDPMKLVHFLHDNPYHVSTLIQVSKIAKQDQNAALASDLCERALYTFGRISLSSFRRRLEQGKARISFSRPENRQFFLASYNYIKNLIQKGTYRTALEWAKLTLSLDPNDPYAMINWIHVLAIRSFEAQWFLDLCDSELLNASAPGGPKITAASYIRQTAVLAKLQAKDAVGAKASLIEGMEKLPWLYCALFAALNLDVPRSIWGVQPGTPEEELYTQLYIHMTKDLWDNPQATSLLKDAAQAAERVDVSLLPPAPAVSLGTARFIYLDNTPALMSEVPHGMLHASPNFDFDPLPPPRAENVFTSDVQALPWDVSQSGGVADLLNRRIAAVDGFDVMQALNDLNIAEDRSEESDDAADGSEGGSHGGLHNVLRRLIDMIGRQVVGQTGNRPTTGGAGQEDDDEEEERSNSPDVVMPGAWMVEVTGDGDDDIYIYSDTPEPGDEDE